MLPRDLLNDLEEGYKLAETTLNVQASVHRAHPRRPELMAHHALEDAALVYAEEEGRNPREK